MTKEEYLKKKIIVTKRNINATLKIKSTKDKYNLDTHLEDELLVELRKQILRYSRLLNKTNVS